MPRISISDPERTLAELDDDVLLGGPEIAPVYRVSPATIRAWRYLGIGPDYLRLSKTSVRYRAGDIKRHLAGLKVTSAADGAAPSIKRAREAEAAEAAA